MAFDGLSRTGKKEDKKASADQAAKPTDGEEEKGLEKVTEPVFEGGDTLILRFIERELLEEEKKKTPAAQVRDQQMFEPRHDRELYKLDKYGVLHTPYARDIALAGLNEQQAAERIGLEAVFGDYLITVTRLPLSVKGKESLQPFGYDVFRDKETLEQAASYMPVPSDYIVGPGDTLQIQLFGKENNQYELEVNREGQLLFPNIGSITAAGLTFSELKRNLKTRIKKQFIGVEGHIAMGQLRSIQVFVLGEVEKPGAFYLGALSTITHALLNAGGITEIGSLRDIQLKRKGQRVTTLDLYELLMKGDSGSDLRLLPGDVIHVPPLGDTVALAGEVLRPAIYELRGGETVADVLAMAGEVLPDAYQPIIRLERVESGRTRKIINVALDEQQTVKVTDGDLIEVYSVADRVDNAVYLSGVTDHPGRYEWYEGMRVADLLQDFSMHEPDLDLHYALIKRIDATSNRISLIDVDLDKVLTDAASKDNVPLQKRDEVMIFSKSSNRQFAIQKLISTLEKQASHEEAAQIVRIQGSVHFPGSYPLTKDMKLSDLLRAGGGLKDSAYTLEAELSRYKVEQGKPRQINHEVINLVDLLAGSSEADSVLQPYDFLTIKEVPFWAEQDQVEVRGEVRFPGKYTIRRGETLAELIERAGGYTNQAFPGGAVFMREELRRREQEQLDTMASNLEAELAAVALQRTGDVTQVSATGLANDLLAKLRNIKAAGRLVLNIKDPQGEDATKIILQGGDRLFIPALMQEVTVLGEVFHPTSHMHGKRMDVEDYVDASGGMTNKADDDNVYVIKANGSVQLARRSWLDPQLRVSAGDTIVVPFDTEKVSSLKLWTDVSQIVYQLGLSVATWNTVGLISL